MFLLRFQYPDNKKDIYLRVTESGKATYKQYSQTIYELCLKDMFEKTDQIPPQYTTLLIGMFDYFAEQLLALEGKIKEVEEVEDHPAQQ